MALETFECLDRAPATKSGPDSDFDILVAVGEHTNLLDIIAVKQDLEDLLGVTVHVVPEDAISPYIREQVLKEAVTL